MTGTTAKAGKRATYPAYKPSGVPWLGDLPEHWEARRLKTILACPITDGPHSTPEFIEDGVPFLSVDGIQDGELVFGGCRHIDDSDHAIFRRKAAPRRNDILLGKAASTGKIARVKVDFEFSIWSPLALIRVEQSIAIPEFVEYALKSPAVQAQIDVLCNANTQKNIGMDDIPRLILPLPNAGEQGMIAAFLDRETARIDALIEKKRRQIELLQEKRSALISHAVTKGLDPNAPMKDSGIEWLGQIPKHWDIRKVKHLTTKIGSGKTPKGGAEVYVDSGVMLFRSQNVHFDGLRLDDVVFIEDEVDAEMANTRVRPGDVLLNITGASLGRCCLVGEDIGPANVNQHVCIIRAWRSKIVPDYLNAAMSSFVAQSQIFASENGTSREGLNFQQVGNLLIVVPPRLEEQDEISRHIRVHTDRMDAIISTVVRSIDQLRELRTAMISAAVTGKIDVRSVEKED